MSLSAYGGVPSYTNANFVTLLSKKYRVYFRRSLVLNAISNTNPQAMAKGMGDTIKIPILPDIRSESATKGQPINYNYLSPSSIDVVIDKLRRWAFPVLDVDKVQSMIPAFADAWAAHAAKNTKEDTEEEVLAGIIGDADASNLGASAGYKTGAYNLGISSAPKSVENETGTYSIVQAVLEMGAVLDERDIPDNDRYLITNPWGYQKLKGALAKANEMGDRASTLRSGKVGSIDRFDVYVCNRLPAISAVASKPVMPVYFGQKEALAFHIQMDDVEKIRLQDVKGDGYRAELLYGWKVVHPTAFGVGYWTPKS